MSEKRKNTRVPILTQVEAQGGQSATLGRASDVSLGGLLIETPDTLTEGASVLVRFFVPPERTPLETAGRVVRVEPGKSMAITFLGLPDSHKQKILEYVRTIHGTRAEKEMLEAQQGSPQERRSARIARRVPVVLYWQDEEGRARQEAGETQLLSKHGGAVLAFTEFKTGQLLRVAVPDTGKEGMSRVVWSKPANAPGRMELALEFVGTENLWDVAFPAATAPAPATYRRRSARLPMRVEVVLSWVDDRGRAREEEAETEMLSKHGAAVRAPVEIPLRHRLRVRSKDKAREVEAHVVWIKASDVPGSAGLGIEFLESEDFWGIPFPTDTGRPAS